MEHQIIEIPLYKTQVDLYIVDHMYTAVQAIEEKYKRIRLNIDFNSKGYSSKFKYKDRYKYLIIIEKGSELSVVAHECLHMSWYILNAVGVTVDAFNHEAQAYLLEYLFNNIYNYLNDGKRKKDTSY